MNKQTKKTTEKLIFEMIIGAIVEQQLVAFPYVGFRLVIDSFTVLVGSDVDLLFLCLCLRPVDPRHDARGTLGINVLAFPTRQGDFEHVLGVSHALEGFFVDAVPGVLSNTLSFFDVSEYKHPKAGVGDGGGLHFKEGMLWHFCF